jgi:hypothetical protein
MKYAVTLQEIKFPKDMKKDTSNTAVEDACMSVKLKTRESD